MTTNRINVTAGSVRQLKSGTSAGRWQATVVLGEGRGAAKRTKTFDTKRDALAWQATAKLDGLPNGDASEQTLAQAFDRYLASHVLATKTSDTYRDAQRHVVAAGLGDTKLAKLRPSVQNTFTTHLVRSGLSATTTNLYAAKLQAVLRFAAADGGLSFRPDAVTVEDRRQDATPLSTDDVAALYEAASDHFAPAVLLGAFAGLRMSEVAAVNVGDVDWSAGTVSVSKAIDSRGQVVATKTKRSVRIVPLPQNVLDQLSAHRFRGVDEPLARNEYGRRLTTKSFVARFVEVARNAGLDGVRSHALRRFYATTLLASGVNPKAVAKWLGDRVETMMRAYALVQPTDDDAGRAVLASTFAATAAA